MRVQVSNWLIAALLVSGVATPAAQQANTDVPQWRGLQRDGSASGFVAPAAWPKQLTSRWKVEIGDGYSTPIVVGDRVFTLSRADGNEVVTAIHADSGKVLWQQRYPAPHKIASGAAAHGQGPKSTPLYSEGKLFTLGITGIVSSFNASDGKLLW